MKARRALVFVAVSIGALLFFHAKVWQRVDFEIPAGYRGWLRADLGKAGCSPATRRGGVRIIKFDPEGRSCSSNRIATRFYTARYYYLSEAGRQTLLESAPGKLGDVWGASTSEQGSFDAWFVFVGSKAEFESGALGRPPMRDLAHSGSWPP
jgi:hypothetical protein